MSEHIQNVLVFGASGLLGKCLIDFYKNNKKIHVAINKTKIIKKNLKYFKLNNYGELDKYIKDNKISLIINFAGLTNIELCEKKIIHSKKSNYILPINLAKIAKTLDIKYVFISTDNFRFNSKKLSEKSPTKSLNIYSLHKKMSEKKIMKINSKSLIIRTNFYCVGSKKRQSFSDRIIRQLKLNREIELFKDVFYTPIYGKYLLRYIFALVDNKSCGIFNVCSNERISKYQFGFKLCKIFKLNNKLLKKINLKDKKGLVKRPLNMALNNNKLKKVLGKKIPSIDYQLKVMKNDFKKLENDSIQ